MAHYSKLFSKVPVAVQNLSGFDLSHENLFSAKCGTLTPCYVQPVIPNTKLTLSLSTEIQLPPMATDFYGKVDGVFEAFFVPYRLLYGGWQELITRPVNNAVYPPQGTSDDYPKYLPKFSIPSGKYGIGSLSDYLGVKVTDDGNDLQILNPLPYLAYHKIYDDWYRNSFVSLPVFKRDLSNLSFEVAYRLPYASFGGNFATTFSAYLYDSTNLFNLRQRNWAKDYFTSATPLPQAGTDVKIEINSEDNSFTWGQLVAQNSLARWMQRTNISGYRYPDQILAGFGVLPPDAIMDRAIYLGRKIVPIYNKSVYQNSGSSGDSSNPFKTVAAKFGAPLGVGNGQLIKRFHAKEHGVFMVLFSMVPRAYYSTGTSRHFKAQTMADFPHPDFANMGDQPIFNSELTNINYSDPNYIETTFGYQMKDSHYKYIDDQVHGELRDGGSLSMFALQRSFSSNPELSSSFLEIPTDFMDQVAAVDGDVSKYGCWVDVHFKAKSSMPLPSASIPTLTDPKDVHTVMVDKGGRTL